MTQFPEVDALPIQPVILSGGSGTRLWPLSRETYPKQFQVLAGDGQSMLQLTALRLQDMPSPHSRLLPPMVICNADHRFLAAQQLAEIGIQRPRIVLEPVGRNTAPALTLAALLAQRDAEDPVLVVMPADHVITDLVAFRAAVEVAQRAAAAGAMVTFGVRPTRPETGYGYIHCKTDPPAEVMSIGAFAEKPSAERAIQYLASGEYLWNSGLFVVRASKWLEALGHFRTDILRACHEALALAVVDHDFVRPDPALFGACPSDSIDYAVMEQLPAASELHIPAQVVALDAGWSDLGAWDALWDVLPRDSAGLAEVGPTASIECTDTLLFSSGRLVAGVGLENVVVVETPDAVLVADKSRTQLVKQLVAQLKQRGRTLADSHRKVHRPWGWYDSIDSGSRFQVKRIVVNPGATLSLQMHHHRAEHWVVVTGTAEVTNGDKVLLLTENESTFIPLGHMHRLSNPGKVPLEIIEVQSGSYLGEDDIVRFEDSYGRAPSKAAAPGAV